VIFDPDATEEDAEECVESSMRKQAIRKQSRFEREMNKEVEGAKIKALWFRLDLLTGEVNVYPRAAAARLEEAHVKNRANVPLAGLGNGLEDAIVHLGTKGSNERPVQMSLQGGQMDVRRLPLRADADEVCIDVLWNNGWRVADVAVPGTTEQRQVVLNGTEMVGPPSPSLPPLNPDRRASMACIRPWWGDSLE